MGTTPLNPKELNDLIKSVMGKFFVIILHSKEAVALKNQRIINLLARKNLTLKQIIPEMIGDPIGWKNVVSFIVLNSGYELKDLGLSEAKAAEVALKFKSVEITPIEGTNILWEEKMQEAIKKEIARKEKAEGEKSDSKIVLATIAE